MENGAALLSPDFHVEQQQHSSGVNPSPMSNDLARRPDYALAAMSGASMQSLVARQRACARKRKGEHSSMD